MLLRVSVVRLGWQLLVKLPIRLNKLTAKPPLLDQVDLLFSGWPYCQVTSLVYETDPCNQFQAYMLECKSIFPS